MRADWRKPGPLFSGSPVSLLGAPWSRWAWLRACLPSRSGSAPYSGLMGRAQAAGARLVSPSLCPTLRLFAWFE
jgi:hypothetical protein